MSEYHRKEKKDLSKAVRFDERLREVAADSAYVTSLQQQLAKAREKNDEGEILRLLGSIGDLSRVLGEVEQAISILEEALCRSKRIKNSKDELANMIRLAEARKYRGDYEYAERMLREAVQRAQNATDPEVNGYLHFAWQHLGKCLMEQSKSEEAIRCLEQALYLRKKIGKQSLIESTEQALAWVKKCKKT